ncbi:MAG: hypothetical protein ACE5HE_08885 [Phycisphaerae bacterium]
MKRPYKPLDTSRITTYSIKQRRHRASVSKLASLPEVGATAAELLNTFPDQLGAAALRQVVGAVVAAVRAERPVVAALGAHVIKAGCGPIIVDLIRRGVISALACNGACAIHDVELALTGETSEDVAETIRDGTFGMVAETLAFFDETTSRARRESMGLGAAVGQLLLEREAPYRDKSIFAAARTASVPACVHVALGTDTVHMSGNADGTEWGAASMHDFRLICDVVSDLGALAGSDVGGVWLNVGSAVVLPEVFLKAVSVARNLGANLDRMTTANFDMLRHYRPSENVVRRPAAPGRGHEVIGHHEILLPLLRQAVIEQLATA